MIIDQLQNNDNLTTTERTIASYILNHPDDIGSMSAADLADRSFTSKSAVLRLCKKLGYSGYRFFQNALTVEYTKRKYTGKLFAREPFDKNSSLKDIMEQLPDFYMNVTNKTMALLDRNVLRRALNYLRHSDIIDIYGAGITYTVAESCAFKFQTIGFESRACEGINEHYLVRTRSKKQKMAIVLSFTGANNNMVRAASFLKRSGYYVLGIGGSDSDILKKSCSDYISLYDNNLIMGTEIISSITSCNYVLDILFVSLMTEQYKQNQETALEVYQFRH